MLTIGGTVSKGYLAKNLGVRFNREYYFNPARRHEVDTACNEYIAKTLPDLPVFYSESNLGQRAHWTPSQVLVGGIQPNMLLGMLMGAQFLPNDAMDADISPQCLAQMDPDDLPDPKTLLEHELVEQFDGQIRSIQAQPPATGLRAIPPFFWDASGRATLHGPMTSTQKYIGESLFMDMVAEPQKAKAWIQWVARAYVTLARHFAEVADLKITGVHAGECSSCMIGPDQFEEFVIPGLAIISEELGNLRFHSCGNSSHLIGLCKQIPNLKTIDVGGQTSLAKVREVFGREFPASIAPMAADLSSPDPKPLLAWARGKVEENQGGELKMVFHLEPNYSLDVVRALCDFVRSAG